MSVRVWPVALVLVSSTVLAQPPVRLTLCVDNPRKERVLAPLLGQWVDVRLAVAPRAVCPGGARTPYSGWFEQRGARVDFVLSHAGVKRRRKIPWLRRRRDALTALDVRGRLATFSVIVRALIAEHRLRWLLDDPPVLSQPKGSPPMEELVVRDHAKPRGAWRRQGLFATTLKALTRTRRPGPEPQRPARRPPMPMQTQLGSLERVASGPGPGDAVAPGPTSAPTDSVQGPALVDEPQAHALFTPVAPPPAPPAPPAPPRRAVDAPPPGKLRVEPGPVPETDADVSAPSGKPFDLGALLAELSLEAQLAGRWRSGDLLALEAGGCLGWRRLFLRAGYQPAAQWELSGRPVRVSAVPLAAGWRPPLWNSSRWRLSLETAVLVERFNLRRLDVPDRDHVHWDAGLATGVGLGLRVSRDLGLGLDLTGFWFPGAKQIEVAYGPSARLTQLGGRLAFSFFWGTDGSFRTP